MSDMAKSGHEEFLHKELRSLVNDRQFSEAPFDEAIVRIVEATAFALGVQRVSAWAFQDGAAPAIPRPLQGYAAHRT